MGCSNCGKTTIKCGDRYEGACVFVEAELPEFSEYKDEGCVTATNLFEELYDEVDNLKVITDLEGYDNKCLENEEVTFKAILQSQTDKICELEARVTFLEDPCNILAMNISECGIDLSSLGIDPCGTTYQVTTLQALLQLLIQEVGILKA